MEHIGKKLLILGGIRFSIEIIKQAQKMGIYVLVTDYYEDSPGKRIADQSFMVSTTDVDAVVNLINEEKIDGMIMGFMDSMLPYYQMICEKAGLPCYVNKEQVEVATHKGKFKQLCRQFNIPVVAEYPVQYPLIQSEIETLPYPVLVKPVDHTGSIGVCICQTPDALLRNYEESLSYSRSKTVLVEKFIDAKQVQIYYLIQDGEICLSAVADRHLTKQAEGIIPLPSAYVFPSRHLENYQEYLNPKVIRMFQSLGLKNGLLFIQAFIDKDDFIFYEMGYRLSGSLENKILSKINGINPMEMLINFALTGSMHEERISPIINPNYPMWGCTLTYLVKPGKIGKIIGVDQVRSMPGVIDVVPAYNEGHIIAETAVGRLQQVVLRVFTVTKTKAEMGLLIAEIHKAIKVINANGEDMLLGVFEPQNL